MQRTPQQFFSNYKCLRLIDLTSNRMAVEMILSASTLASIARSTDAEGEAA